ncbi:MAG: transposase [Planctomycetes bacterium]|nr:transposase [Planctomycetota bacterium]
MSDHLPPASSDRHLCSPRRRSRAVDVVRLMADAAAATQPIVDAMLEAAIAPGHAATDDTRRSRCCRRAAHAEEQPTVAPLGLCRRAAGRRRVRLFTAGRSGAGPGAHPGGLPGGYLAGGRLSGYHRPLHRSPIIEAGCMMHARRKFYDALDSCSEHSEPVLRAFKHLYQVERRAKVEDPYPDQRLALRLPNRKTSSIPSETGPPS